MYYKIILIWICFLAQISCRTNISKNQCPDMFKLVTANTTNIIKQKSKDINSKFYALYDNDYLKSSVQAIVIQGDPQALTNFIFSRSIIYIILLGVFIVVFITSSICCLFDKSCPPRKLRRDLKKRPYTIRQFRIMFILTLTFTVATIVTCLVAFTFLPQLKNNLYMTKCSIYIVLDAVLNGQKDTGWGGFNNLLSKIKSVTKYLQESLPSMSQYLSDDDWLIQQMQAMKQINLNVYKNNKNATLITPNPTTTKIALQNGLSYPMIESRFVVRGMGPNGTSNTMATDIDRGLRTTEKLSQLAYSIEVGAKRIVDSSQTLLENTNKSLQLMNMYIDQLNKTNQSIDQLKSFLFVEILRDGLILIEAGFGLQILGGFLCLLGIIATYKYQIFKCKSIVQLAWTFFGFGFAISIVVVFATLGIGSLGYGFCNYFDDMTTSKQEYSKLGASYSQNPFTKLDSCFFGDGNVLSKFSLSSEMETVTKLFELIKKYYDYENQLSTNYIDKSISVGKITNWMNAINNYKKGIYIDFNQSITNDDNPNYVLKSLNLYTNGGAGIPVCTKDRWVWDSTNCTQFNESVYVAGTAQNGQDLSTVNKSICISFNQRFSDQMTNSWSISDILRRYRQIRGACIESYARISEYSTTIIGFRDSRINLYQGIFDELNNLYIKNVNFNQNLTNFKDKLLNFQSSVTDLNDAVSNSINGLLVSSNCHYIADTLKFTYNTFCINVMYDVVQIGWCAIFTALFSLFGMIFSYIFASWFTDVEGNPKWFQEEGYTGDDIVEIGEVSSTEIIKPGVLNKKVEEFDIGKDFEMLGQFESYTGGKSKKQIQRQKQLLQMKQMKQINSDQSQQQENPYVKQLKG